MVEGPSAAQIDGILKGLPDELRQMLVAKHLTGMSYAQLAERFGVSEQAVAERLCRARKMIRKGLQNGEEEAGEVRRQTADRQPGQ